MTKDGHARGEQWARQETGLIPAANLRLAYARIPEACPERFEKLLAQLKAREPDPGACPT